MPDSYRRFSRQIFESLNIEGDDRTEASKLTGDLELDVLSKMTELPGWEGVEEVIEALNRHGHRFERRETDEGWASYFQETNDGARDFWIHANREEDILSVNVLYFEKLEVTEARRRAEISEGERAVAELDDAFYDGGLKLVERYEAYSSLPDRERLHLALFLLETGVSNGGFKTYIVNTEGAHLADAVGFLEAVGAPDLEAIVRDVIRLFPSGFGKGLTEDVWEALEGHDEELDSLDSRFYASDDHLSRLVMTYLGKT